MTDDVLLEFLKNGLIDVGGDDDKLDHLRQAAGDLASLLLKTPAKAVPFALVAFDPDVSSTDPTIVEVENALLKRWETYVNTFADPPIRVFRAMLLDALMRACEKDDAVAVAFSASARNALPFMEVGEERGIWLDVVGEIERQVEKRAEKEWATPETISAPDLKSKSFSEVDVGISPKSVDLTALGEKFSAAAGPQFTSPEGETIDTEGNPHWLQNDPAGWTYEFGTRAAEAVGEAIAEALGKSSVEGVDLPGIAEDLTEMMSEHLASTLRVVGNATAGLQRRTNLLWWKETLFSPSVRKGYGEMTPFEAAALMAFDLYRQIPTLSPTSVTAFLRETARTLPTIDQERTLPIRVLVDRTCEADILSELRTEAAKLVGGSGGRGSVLAVIGHPETVPQIDGPGFRDRTGVTPDTALTLPDWSVWLFRELQAARGTVEASTPKRRTARKRAPKKRIPRK